MSLEILTFSFMHRALISGVAIAILCSVIGLFLVLRRYSLFGDAIAHSSFGGIALGLMAGVYPLWTAYGVSLVSALIITKIKEKYDISGDAAIAVLLSSGIAVGLVIVGISGGFTIDIFSFLFGSILLVSVNETILILSLTGIQLLYSTFNEEQAKVSGIPVEKINYLIVFMAGLTVVTSIQLVEQQFFQYPFQYFQLLQEF
jgi:zinc transport system permease protein